MIVRPVVHAASLLLAACSHVRPPPALPHAAPCPAAPHAPAEPVQPALALGYDLSCALLADATVRCWGAGRWEEPTVVPGLTDVRSLSAYGHRTCAARGDGSVWCWLRVDERDVQVEGAVAFQRIAGVDGARSVAVGASHACVVRVDGGVDCWAFEPLGTLAAGAGGPRPEARVRVGEVVRVPNLSGATAVAAARHHSCAIVAGGRVACWGVDFAGACGAPRGLDWDATERGAVLVPGITDVVQLALGEHLTCARRANGTVRCWGFERTEAELAKWLPRGDVRWIAAGGETVCAVLGTGSLRCFNVCREVFRAEWGRPSAVDWRRRTRYPDACYWSEEPSPDAVTWADATTIALGGGHACMHARDGRVWCMGDNSVGQLGDFWTVARAEPIPVMTAEGEPTPESARASHDPPSRTSKFTSELTFVPIDLRAPPDDGESPSAHDQGWRWRYSSLFLRALRHAAPRIRGCLGPSGGAADLRIALPAGDERRAVVTAGYGPAPTWAACVRDALAGGAFPRATTTIAIGLPLRW